MNKKQVRLIIVFLIIASCATFGRIGANDFINFDDNLYITENVHVQSGFSVKNISWAFTAIVVSNWHPLTLLSHMLDWSLFGSNAAGHHLVSLLLHIGAVILLFLFLYKTTHRLWPSAFAAAFFALHPLRVESVAWAAERKDVLSMFFAMATLYTYAFYVENRKISKYLLCLILFALALMSKPMMVTLPFVLLLLDYWPLKRLDSLSTANNDLLKKAGRLLSEKIPFFMLTIAVSAIAFWAQNKVGAMVTMENISFIERLSNAVVSYGNYLGKIFWPVNLAVFYPFEHSLPMWKVLISALILIIITASAFYFIKKLPFLFTGWFLYLGTLVPVIGLIQVGDQGMADRYTYLPSIGLVIIMSWGIPHLFKHDTIRRNILFPAAFVIIALMAMQTWQQCGQWKNSMKISSHALRVTENNYKMHHNMGTSYYKAGKTNEAIYHFNKAIRINPNSLSYNSRGDIFARMGRYRQALDDFNKAIASNPRDAYGHYNRGLLYDRIGEYSLALADFTRAISIRSDDSHSFNNRGIIYAKLDQLPQAVKDFTKAITLNPDYAPAYGNRAIAYFSQGENQQGCRDAQKACALGNCSALKFAQGKGWCR